MATGQDIADEARADLIDSDASNYRWPDAQLIEHINAAARAIVEIRPEANVVEEQVTVSSGTSRLALPSGGIKFLRAWNTGSAQSGLVVAVGNTASGTDMIMTSPDGINWTQRDHVSGGPWNFNSIGISPTIVTIGADDNTNDGTYWSEDSGVTWTQGDVDGAAPPDRMRFEEIIYVAAWSRFIGVGTSTDLGNADAAYSNDGKTWQLVALSSNATMQCCAYSPTLDYVLGLDNDTSPGANVYFTTDNAGLVWADTTWDMTESSIPRSLVWSTSLGLFCSLHADGSVHTSPTGQTWTQRATLGVGYAAELEWSESEGLAVIVGNSGAQTSTDFITWTPRTMTAASWTTVTYSDFLDLWIAVNVGGTSEVATSPDGITWTDRTVEFNENWTEVKAGTLGAVVRGPAMTILERDALNSPFPEWTYDQAYTTHLSYPDAAAEHTLNIFDHYVHDPREPKVFHVFPANAGSATVYVQFSKIPTALSTLADTFPLGDEYLDAAIAFVRYRMIAKDDKRGLVSDKSMDAYQDFARALEAQRVTGDRMAG